MPGLFSSVNVFAPKRNKFDLSHERKLTYNFTSAQLVPILVQDILPGDRFRVNTELFLRFAPLLAPIMHRINVYMHYFFVPNRLVWDEWEDFITGGREGTSAPLMPYVELNDTSVAMSKFVPGSLADYMGIPPIASTPVTDPLQISALSFRAYQLIYDNYFRDQNLEASLDISKASGAITGAELDKVMAFRGRAWEKDYFTSALPWAQRGPEVAIPVEIEGFAPLYVNPLDAAATQSLMNATENPGSISVGYGMDLEQDTTKIPNGKAAAKIENLTSSTSINELRRSVRLQEWLEKNARGGARYVEQIWSHFKVKSKDARLQRPEYLGGGVQPVSVSEVLSTFQTEAEGLPQGNMSGHAISVGRSNGFKRFFEEHGYVIGLMSVLPKTAYQQGVARHFRRFDKFDFAWPEFANIGEQEIRMSELYYAPGDPAGQKDELFGYTPRYAEYKYAPSTVHGEFRDDLAFWHEGRIFDSKPSLNQGFVMADPTGRSFATGDPQLYVQLYNRVDAVRPLPYFGTPTI